MKLLYQLTDEIQICISAEFIVHHCDILFKCNQILFCTENICRNFIFIREKKRD